MMELGDMAVSETVSKDVQVRPLLSAQQFLLVQRIEFLATNQAMGVRVAQRKPNDSCAHEKCDGYDRMSFYMDNFDMNPEETKSMRIALVVYNAEQKSWQFADLPL